MKKIIFLSIVLLSLSLLFSCNKTNSKKIDNQTNVSDKSNNITEKTIQVYYFHGSIRCETCVAVDDDTHKYLKELFPEKIDKNEIIFKSINIDKEERPDLVEKYQIYGQTLLIIKGKKVIDLTDSAFQYVTTNPEKWKNTVKDVVYDLIK